MPQPGEIKGTPECYAYPDCTPVNLSVIPTLHSRQTSVSVQDAGYGTSTWTYTGGKWSTSEFMYIGVLNMRNTEVTHRIPLEDCGDAKVNVTAYEDCDITATGNAAYNYAYTTANTGNGAAAYTQDNPTG